MPVEPDDSRNGIFQNNLTMSDKSDNMRPVRYGVNDRNIGRSNIYIRTGTIRRKTGMENERRKVLKHFIEQEGYMNERVADGIEHARKGLFGITVTDAEGRPVPGAKIIIHQTDHEFRMGANCFALSEMKTDEQLAEYKKLFSECFNLATLPFYWRSVEPERGKTRSFPPFPSPCPPW